MTITATSRITVNVTKKDITKFSMSVGDFCALARHIPRVQRVENNRDESVSITFSTSWTSGTRRLDQEFALIIVNELIDYLNSRSR